ncbi:hypothetical protein C1N70_08210 [Cytobacillus firmus]
MSIARPNATAFGRKWVTKTLPQDKESYGSDTSHDRKRLLLGGRGDLSLCSLFGLYIMKRGDLPRGDKHKTSRWWEVIFFPSADWLITSSP